MKALFLFSLLAFFASAVFAWTKEDHEIFDLVSALEAAEGKGTTFYSWLEVSPSASTVEISKAYRKKSMQLHPDKNPGVKNIHERFARLSVIGKILRDSEDRKRYDFFFKNGVPRWRGTGYYYSRFRPGLGTVLIFLAIVSSAVQYVVQRANYNRDVARIEHICGEARSAAWGPKRVPTGVRRKVKVALGAPRMDEDGNVVPGRTLDMVVEANGDVYIVEDGGDLTLLDTSHTTPPAVSRTWVISLARTTYSALVARSARPEVGSPSGAGQETRESLDTDDGASSTGAEQSDADGSRGSKKNAGSVAAEAAKSSGRKKKAARKRG